MMVVKSGEERNEVQKLRDEIELLKCENANLRLVIKAITTHMKKIKRMIKQCVEE